MSGCSDLSSVPNESSPTPAPEQLVAKLRPRRRWPKRVELLAAGTLVATFANVGVAIYQWKAMQRQAKIMERQTKAMEDANEFSQRAWLTVRNVTLAKALVVGETPAVAIEIVNSGQSPARDVIIAGTVLSRESLAEALSGKADGPIDSRMVIGPGTSVFTDLDASEPVTRQGQIDAIINGLSRLYATGVIRYLDIFEKQRETEFCFRATGKDDLEKRRLGACASGNSVK